MPVSDLGPRIPIILQVLSSAAQAVEPACSIYEARSHATCDSACPSLATRSTAEAVDLREVPECISEFQLTQPAQLQPGKKKL